MDKLYKLCSFGRSLKPGFAKRQPGLKTQDALKAVKRDRKIITLILLTRFYPNPRNTHHNAVTETLIGLYARIRLT